MTIRSLAEAEKEKVEQLVQDRTSIQHISQTVSDKTADED